MAHYGWMINLTGAAIPVYSVDGGGPSTTQIGTITKNECFIDGVYSAVNSSPRVLFVTQDSRFVNEKLLL